MARGPAKVACDRPDSPPIGTMSVVLAVVLPFVPVARRSGMTVPENSLKQTPLNAAHRALGGKMIPFGQWDMPVQYRGILEEHRAVRSAAGLFDVCHMGEVEFRGAGALPALQRLTSNDVSRLQIGQIQYSALTTEAGTFVDDLTVYRLADDRYLTTLNASNIEKDVRWMREHAEGAEIVDLSDDTGLVAIQGPR